MGLKRPCVHWPQHPTLRLLGRAPPRAHLRKGTKRASGSCLLERETLLGKASSAPVRVCSAKQRLPVSPLGLCSPFGLGGSGLPPAPCAPVLGRGSPELETTSKRALLQGEGGWGLKRPCVHWPQHPTLRLRGRDPPRAHLREGTKRASGSCLLTHHLTLTRPTWSPGSRAWESFGCHHFRSLKANKGNQVNSSCALGPHGANHKANLHNGQRPKQEGAALGGKIDSPSQRKGERNTNTAQQRPGTQVFFVVLHGMQYLQSGCFGPCCIKSTAFNRDAFYHAAWNILHSITLHGIHCIQLGSIAPRCMESTAFN